MIRKMGLGLPFWGFEGWRGGLYTEDSRPSDFLKQYAHAFNAVEGNTTFYAVPSERTVARWCAEVPDDFRFCFKLPKTMTHDALLYGVEAEAEAFLGRLRPLRAKMGPVMIQLPPQFGTEGLTRLAEFLAQLPDEFRYAVEFRDEMLAQDGMAADLANEILEEAGAGRVIMDTRPLREGPGNHPEVRAARDKKPNLPVREEVLSQDPIVRIVYHPEAVVNERWLEYWSRRLAHWIGEGLDPIVFVHSPSNRESPEIARELHGRIAKGIAVGEMPVGLGESGESASGQLALL